MNTVICKLSALFLVALSVSIAQIDSPVCADALSQYAYTGPTQRGGLYITSQGSIRALVIFIQFRFDDFNPSSQVWPIGGSPTYFNTFLDPDVNNPTNSGNISHFYRKMSFDRLKIYGDPHIYTTKFPESHYRALYGDDAYGYVNREALARLDGEINYADYDNWTFGTYNHTPAPDGRVDLIIMFYRSITTPAGETGIAQLGEYNSQLGNPVLDGKEIAFGFPGSGLTNNGGSFG